MRTLENLRVRVAFLNLFAEALSFDIRNVVRIDL